MRIIVQTYKTVSVVIGVIAMSGIYRRQFTSEMTFTKVETINKSSYSMLTSREQTIPIPKKYSNS